MGILDKFKDKKIGDRMFKMAKSRENLNFNYDQVTAYAKKVRDRLQSEHPGKYELYVDVKTPIGWRSGMAVPTDMDYIYIFNLDIYDNLPEHYKHYLETGLPYNEINFIINEIKK